MTGLGVGNGRVWAWLAIAAAGIALLYVLSPILAPFLAGAILAYILNPLVGRLTGRRLPRSVAAGLVLLLAIAVVTAVLLLVLPLLVREARMLAERLPDFLNWLNLRAVPWINQTAGLQLALDIDSLRAWITEALQTKQHLLPKLFDSLKIGGLALLGFMANLLLMPVVLFYLLRDWDTMMRRIEAMVPRRLHAKTLEIAREIDAVLAEFLRGQLTVILAMSAYYAIGLWLAGLEFALPLGLLIGLLTIVPYAGPVTGYTLAVMAALLQFDSPGGVLAVGVALGAGQLLESLVVTPLLVGERIGLHPVAVIFALLAFGQFFGFFGVLLALPASAALLVGLRHLRSAYLASPLYREDRPPEPARPTQSGGEPR
jgi:predicted PurR-regulated permease PerM